LREEDVGFLRVVNDLTGSRGPGLLESRRDKGVSVFLHPFHSEKNRKSDYSLIMYEFMVFLNMLVKVGSPPCMVFAVQALVIDFVVFFFEMQTESVMVRSCIVVALGAR